jgi:hypothetical protein
MIVAREIVEAAVICAKHLRAAEVGSRIDAGGLVIGEVTAALARPSQRGQ